MDAGRTGRSVFGWLLLALSAAALAACGSDDAGGAGTGGSGGDGFAASVQPIFDGACNCHQSSPLSAPFSLQAMDAYDNLVEAPSTEVDTMPLVTAGNPDKSYLWHKLNGTQLDVGGSGTRMPVSSPLDASELDVIEHWIMDGAAP